MVNENETPVELKPNEIEVYSEINPLIKRSYEKCKAYFLTFKPFNGTYETDPNYYQVRALDAVVCKLKPHCSLIIATREMLDCAKTHINIFCQSNIDLVSKYHEKTSHNKFKIYCKEVEDKYKVIDYILKESKRRYFIKNQDYRIFDPYKSTSTRVATGFGNLDKIKNIIDLNALSDDE